MEHSKFSVQLTPTEPTAGLGFEVWINDSCVFNAEHVKENVIITSDLPSDDAEGNHVLKFVLKNKSVEHTQINESGEIVKDATLTVSNLTFDGVELGHIANKLTVYQHDFNGTQSPIIDSFFGTMGCNGTAELKFTTPIYLWLLENM